MIRLEMKNYNMIITEKRQKHQHYHLEKFIYLTGEEILPSDHRRLIEQAKYTYSLSGKAFEKQKRLKSKEENKLKQLKSVENN